MDGGSSWWGGWVGPIGGRLLGWLGVESHSTPRV